MKQNYSICKNLLVLVFAIFLVMSCVNHNYDFENIKDLNTDITVGGSEFAIPIGSLDPIQLSQFLTKDDFVTINNGRYEITHSGVFKVEVPKVSIKSFIPVAPKIDPIVVEFNEVKRPNFDLAELKSSIPIGKQTSVDLKGLPLPDMSVSAETSFSADINNDDIEMDLSIADLSKELIGVKTVQFSQPSTIALELKLVGIPSNAQVEFGKYAILLPDFLLFEDPIIQSSRQLVLDDKKFVDGEFNANIKIIGFVFPTALAPSTDGKLIVKGKLLMNGNILLLGENIDSGQLEEVVMTPSISIGEIAISKVTANINPDFTIAPLDFSLDNIPDFLTGPGVRLDLLSVAVALDVENSMDVKMNLGIDIIPYSGSDVITSQKVSQKNITIQSHPFGSTQPSTKTSIWLSNSELGMPEGYVSYLNPTLVNLIETIPDKIKIQPTVLVDQTNLSTIDLNKEYTVDMRYKLVAPLALGKDFVIAYTELVDDLHEDLADYLGYVTTVELLASIINDIPLQFTLDAKPMDASGVPLTGVKIVLSSKQGGEGLIRSCDAQGAAIRSDVVLSISETTKGALSKLDKIDLTFTMAANQMVAGQSLRADQSLKVQLAARIPGGVTINNKL